MGRRRTIAVVVAVAVGSLALGFGLATQIQSPQEAAARAAPPEASLVTVPVEERELVSQVVTRGDAVFAGAVEVAVEVASLETPAVVTGQIPAVGDTLEEGAVALEVVGRPVIALAGELPTYRSLSPGMQGPDVEQLEAALERLGIDPGDATDGRYDLATAAGVEMLFQRAGYEPPPISEEIRFELDAAEDAVAVAEDGLAAAQAALAAATAGPPRSAVIAAEGQVDDATWGLEQAREHRDQHAADIARAEDDLADAEASGDDVAIQEAEARLDQLRAEDPEAAVRSAETQLKVAEASLQELLTPADAASAQAAVAHAEEALTDARRERDQIAATAGTPVPAAEVIFVPTLPRRVDDVSVARGGLVDGPVMSVSGADLVVVASLSAGDRDLVEAGMAASLEGGDLVLDGEITEMRERDSGGVEAVIAPSDLDPSTVDQLRGANLKVTIPIEATDGTVLAVPLAALTAGPDGGSRVEVVTGEDDSVLVAVDVGLAAAGYAEVTPTDGTLEVGDDVVVGR